MISGNSEICCQQQNSDSANLCRASFMENVVMETTINTRFLKMQRTCCAQHAGTFLLTHSVHTEYKLLLLLLLLVVYEYYQLHPTFPLGSVVLT